MPTHIHGSHPQDHKPSVPPPLAGLNSPLPSPCSQARAFLERWIRGFARQAGKEALRNQPDLFCIPAPAP
eukprot:397320-Pelagomonas_calceolata.AAC.1